MAAPLSFRTIVTLSLTLILFGGGCRVLEGPSGSEFTSLFNDEDLSGWSGDVAGYTVEDGNLVCLKEGGGNLYTESRFSDFHLRLEIKLEPGGNNGIGLRAEKGKDAAYYGMEVQILDDYAPSWANLKPWQYHGSIYGVVPAIPGSLKPAGEWNRQEIIARGNHIIVRVNGKTVVDADIAEAAAAGTPDGKEHPGLFNETGHIAFLGHGHRVEFRNIEIKRL